MFVDRAVVRICFPYGRLLYGQVLSGRWPNLDVHTCNCSVTADQKPHITIPFLCGPAGGANTHARVSCAPIPQKKEVAKKSPSVHQILPTHTPTHTLTPPTPPSPPSVASCRVRPLHRGPGPAPRLRRGEPGRGVRRPPGHGRLRGLGGSAGGLAPHVVLALVHFANGCRTFTFCQL